MSLHYGWKSFCEDEDRPEKPRRYGVTEMRGPHYTLLNQNALQDILESMGQFVDGLKFSGGSNSLMPKAFIKEITDMAHKHNVYVSTGDWAEHLLRKGPAAFEQYVEECKDLGFDTIELNAGSLRMPEESLLRFVRLIKRGGLKAKPQFTVKFDTSDIPARGHRAFGAYIAPVPQQSEVVEDVDLLIRRAERCLEAGADMIMIDADDVCKYADSLRTDIIAKIIGRIGIQKTMFETSNPDTSEWFIRRYGPKDLPIRKMFGAYLPPTTGPTGSMVWISKPWGHICIEWLLCNAIGQSLRRSFSGDEPGVPPRPQLGVWDFSNLGVLLNGASIVQPLISTVGINELGTTLQHSYNLKT